MDPELAKLIEIAATGSDAERGEAIYGIESFGPNAAPAINVLMQALTNEVLAPSARRALAHIGPTVIPHIRQELNDGKVETRRHAAEILGQIGKPSRVAIKDLVQCLGHSDVALRANAADAIIEICADETNLDFLEIEWSREDMQNSLLIVLGNTADPTVSAVLENTSYEFTE